MKKFAFKLERMLGFKRTLYEKERNELARLRAERNQIQQRRDDTERQIIEVDAAFRKKAAEEGVHITDITSMNYQRTNAEHLVEALEREIAEMDVRIAKQLEVVIQLDKDVKGLEKLREKQWDEYQRESMKEEQERIMELVSSKYIEDQAEQRLEDLRQAEAQNQ